MPTKSQSMLVHLLAGGKPVAANAAVSVIIAVMKASFTPNRNIAMTTISNATAIHFVYLFLNIYVTAVVGSSA